MYGWKWDRTQGRKVQLQGLRRPGPGPAQRHFYHILFVKASQKAIRFKGKRKQTPPRTGEVLSQRGLARTASAVTENNLPQGLWKLGVDWAGLWRMIYFFKRKIDG